MFRLDDYINDLLQSLKSAFKERLVYLGLQGSYLRKEENENSDIDIMAVIDGLTKQDLEKYKKILMGIGYYEKSCGFICSKADLSNWNPLEVCQLLHTTKDLHGVLSELLPSCSLDDEKNYIKLSLGNLYHELCHRYIHADKQKNINKLPLTYKSVYFIMQNLYYIKTGVFYNSKAELLEHLKEKDKEVMNMAIILQTNREYDFECAFNSLFLWCQNTLSNLLS